MLEECGHTEIGKEGAAELITEFALFVKYDEDGNGVIDEPGEWGGEVDDAPVTNESKEGNDDCSGFSFFMCSCADKPAEADAPAAANAPISPGGSLDGHPSEAPAP